MIDDEYNIPNKNVFIDFAEIIYQILNMQKTTILAFEEKDINILRNDYFYGYVWGFTIIATDFQEKKNNFKCKNEEKVFILHYCFSKFFELEMSYKVLMPILDILIDKKSEEGNIGMKDGVKEGKEWTEHDIPCVGMIAKNSGMDKNEYDALRSKRLKKL